MNRQKLLDASAKKESVRKEFELVRLLAQSPHTVQAELRKAAMTALGTQGTFAAFAFPSEGIVGMALNTHKAIADEVLDDGYAALDGYRRAARERAKTVAAGSDEPNRGTLRWYKDEYDRMTEEVNRIGNSISLMTLCLDEVLRLAQEFAVQAGEQDYFRRRVAEVTSKFPRP